VFQSETKQKMNIPLAETGHRLAEARNSRSCLEILRDLAGFVKYEAHSLAHDEENRSQWC